MHSNAPLHVRMRGSEKVFNSAQHDIYLILGLLRSKVDGMFVNNFSTMQELADAAGLCLSRVEELATACRQGDLQERLGILGFGPDSSKYIRAYEMFPKAYEKYGGVLSKRHETDDRLIQGTRQIAERHELEELTEVTAEAQEAAAARAVLRLKAGEEDTGRFIGQDGDDIVIESVAGHERRVYVATPEMRRIIAAAAPHPGDMVSVRDGGRTKGKQIYRIEVHGRLSATV